MDVLICYFDADDSKIKTRYLDSHFFGHSTHTDLTISVKIKWYKCQWMTWMLI